MQNKDLEQGLRDRIYDHEMPVDTDQLWLDVQANLHPKKKRRAVIWWWLPGLLLIGSLGWFAFSTIAQNTARTQDASKVEVQAMDVPNSAATSIKQSTAVAEESPVAPLDKSAKAEVSESAKDVSEIIRSLPKSTRASAMPLAPAPSAPATAPKIQEAVPAANTTIASTTKNLAGTKQLIMAAPRIESLPVALLPSRSYDPETPPFSELKDPACPVFTKRRKAQWSIGAAGIASKLKREITSPFQGENDQRSRNLMVERPLNAFSGQLLVGYETGSGFSLRSGLGYTRINSVAEVSLDTTITSVGTGITEIIVNGPGDTTFITGIVERRITTTGTSRFYNRLSTVDVPILLGKTFRAGKWRFGVEAGPVLNILSRGNARYQKADGTFSTRAENEYLFRKRLAGIGWQGSLMANFQVLPKLDVGIGLNAYQQPKGGFEITESATRTRYTSFGVRLGMKRYF
jgi:hypothetical protein